MPAIKATLLSLGLLMLSSSAMPSSNSINVVPAQAHILAFDCKNYKGHTMADICKNMCFGSFCAGNGQTFSYDKPDTSTAHKRARAAGCRTAKGSPCRDKKDTECDEFPFKTVEDVHGGTRIWRCVPKNQNQGQGKLLSAFYNSKKGCNKKKCHFSIGYENSGDIHYCDKKTCKNDGEEYAGKDLVHRETSQLLNNDTMGVSELFASPDVSPITYHTNFRTASGVDIVAPAGAQIGQSVVRMSVTDCAAWDAYIERSIAAQANMTEEEYWADQVAPASQELLNLVDFETTTIEAEVHV